MQIRISLDDGVPIYRQIVNQVKRLVASMRLVAGDEMPPIRQLAQQLVINPNTVARAYRELEAAGIVVSRRGSGTTVAVNGSPLSRREKTRLISERADALLTEASQLGLAYEDVVTLLEKRHEQMTNNDYVS